MLSTSGLLHLFMEEGRSDKIDALNDFLALVDAEDGLDLDRESLIEDPDVLIIPCDKAFFVASDMNWN